MKKGDILNLIRCYAEHNDAGFRAQAYEIAHLFEASGDTQLAAYIMSLLSSADAFVPQQMADEVTSPFLEKVSCETGAVFLPDVITRDIAGIVNAVRHRIGIHKFLFQGPPGTGKTEGAKQLAKILGRELYTVNAASLVDSKLGQTQKNIADLFKTIDAVSHPDRLLVLFDEIDALALDRQNSNDVQEMARACTALFKGMDALKDDVVMIATTNLFPRFDKALVRRFDFVVDFGRYTDEELSEIAEKMLDAALSKVVLANRDVRLFRKLLKLKSPLPHPGVLQNLIRTAVAFSDPDNGSDYFARLYAALTDGKPCDARELRRQGFTVREIGMLTKTSKSGVGRILQEAE